ncbi:MAG: ferritin-like protein, partial [Terracidiphilus sp.]|jgi:hypothetical protein
MQLEHATIPPYLLAMYSIHPGTNSDAVHVFRVVVVEEMLHLTFAANILNAVSDPTKKYPSGSTPDLTTKGFVPLYPAGLPDGEEDFKVDLQKFSKSAVDTCLKIERPGKAPDEGHRIVSRKRAGATPLGVCPGVADLHFYSIGEFYEEIERGLEYLSAQYKKEGKELFIGDPARQVTPEFYYSGGGELFAVTDIETARAAIHLIIGQGEGIGWEIYNTENELAHYFRFQQLQLGKYYQAGDKPDAPTGPPVNVDWDAVYPMKTNARLADYAGSSELHDAAVAFNQGYAEFLALLTAAYNGNPKLLLDAVPKMFTLRNKINQLIHNPIPGLDGVNAAPTFEISNAPSEVAS